MQSKQKYYFILKAFLGIIFFQLAQEKLFSQHFMEKEAVLFNDNVNFRD
jgi:hypothetical protein